MVIGENMVPVHGYARGGDGGATRSALLERVAAYAESVPDGVGGVVVQQSTEDADSEVWNLLYSDPGTRPLRDSGGSASNSRWARAPSPDSAG